MITARDAFPLISAKGKLPVRCLAERLSVQLQVPLDSRDIRTVLPVVLEGAATQGPVTVAALLVSIATGILSSLLYDLVKYGLVGRWEQEDDSDRPALVVVSTSAVVKEYADELATITGKRPNEDDVRALADVVLLTLMESTVRERWTELLELAVQTKSTGQTEVPAALVIDPPTKGVAKNR